VRWQEECGQVVWVESGTPCQFHAHPRHAHLLYRRAATHAPDALILPPSVPIRDHPPIARDRSVCAAAASPARAALQCIGRLGARPETDDPSPSATARPSHRKAALVLVAEGSSAKAPAPVFAWRGPGHAAGLTLS